MTDIFGSEQDAVEQESEVEQTSGSRFAAVPADDDGSASSGTKDADVVDAEVVDDELDDDATGIISGSAPEFADVTAGAGPARRVPRLAAPAAGRVRELQEAGGQAAERPGGPGRRVAGGEAAPGARHPGPGHLTISATPSRPTAAPWWPPPASCATCWPKRASSGSTRWARSSTPTPTRRSAICPPRTTPEPADRPVRRRRRGRRVG